MRIGEGRIFIDGGSQAVRLPDAYRFPGKRVRVSRVGNGLLLTPVIEDIQEWFAAMDKFGGSDFFAEGRDQPQMPPDEDLFD